MNKTALRIYFKLFGYWLVIKQLFFRFVPRVYIVKDTETMKDCTLAYYLNSKRTGTYLVKIMTESSTKHTLHKGSLNTIQLLDLKASSYPKRRNIIMYDGEKVIDRDLNILDDFYSNTGDMSLSLACKLLQIPCDRVKIISPTFDFVEYEIGVLSLSDIYC